MIEKTNSLIMLIWNLIIDKIEFKMKLQSFFLFGIFPSANKT